MGKGHVRLRSLVLLRERKSLAPGRLLRELGALVIRRSLLARKCWGALPVSGEFRVRISENVSFLYHAHPGDGVGRLLFWTGRIEPETTSVFVLLASNARGIIDIGANTGYYTLLACACSENAVIISFEPIPRVFSCLYENVSVNGWVSRCDLRSEAAGDHATLVDMYVPEDKIPTSSYVGRIGENTEVYSKLKVKISIIDDIIKNEEIDLVKIDVEGFEDRVLAGMANTIRRFHPAMIFECNPDGPFQEVESLLRSHGYEVYHLKADCVERVDQIVPKESDPYHNYLCLSPESYLYSLVTSQE